jgi:hypothetical protein
VVAADVEAVQDRAGGNGADQRRERCQTTASDTPPDHSAPSNTTRSDGSRLVRALTTMPEPHPEVRDHADDDERQVRQMLDERVRASCDQHGVDTRPG